MELYVLLEFLKFFLIGLEAFQYFISRKREKTMIATLESYNQRLFELERKIKDKP